jgi:hypothetical protein
MTFKRNDVVFEKKPECGFTLYGRINRILSATEIEVIDCGKFFTVYRPDQLEKIEYKGYWWKYGDKLRFNRMPSLRKLKQMAARYDKRVWKKYR